MTAPAAGDGGWEEPGLWEELLTDARLARLEALDPRLRATVEPLRDVEASDRLSRYAATVVARVIDALPEKGRAANGVALLRATIADLARLRAERPGTAADDLPSDQVLHAIERLLPTGDVASIDRPLTPLLDTTVLTNARGEPALAAQLRAEMGSASSIDAIIAFIRRSGIAPLTDALRRRVADGGRVRILTTTYTGSTEGRALDELAALGAEVRVSYDLGTTRLHAKAWLFHRPGSISTAFLGSSNLTHSAQFSGVEWNVRLSAARNPDAFTKMAQVFDAYWAGAEYVPYEPGEFARRSAAARGPALQVVVPPTEVVLRPFQEALLERIALARSQEEHRNLLVSATGTGKTVMAAVDYARLRPTAPGARLLFVAHRAEILEQSLATFRHVLRDAAFGELWVGGHQPRRPDLPGAARPAEAEGAARADGHAGASGRVADPPVVRRADRRRAPAVGCHRRPAPRPLHLLRHRG